VPDNRVRDELHSLTAIHNKDIFLTLEEKYKIAQQLTQCIMYLHTNTPPIVHRELKPENVLLDPSLDVKLADFGLARPLTRFRSEEQTTTCIGTARFMAPELFDWTMANQIGVEVDIWALGCIFIELFSGRRPWDYISSAKANTIYFEIFHRKAVPIPSEIPRYVQAIISKCCLYNPQSREEVMKMLAQCKA
jgi:serine/threonine protein kinase